MVMCPLANVYDGCSAGAGCVLSASEGALAVSAGWVAASVLDAGLSGTAVVSCFVAACEEAVSLTVAAGVVLDIVSEFISLTVTGWGSELLAV